MDSISGPVKDQPAPSAGPLATRAEEVNLDSGEVVHPVSGSPPPAQPQPGAPSEPPDQPRLPNGNRWRRPVGIGLLAASLIAGAIFAATHTNTSKAALQQDASQRFNPQSAALSTLAGQLGTGSSRSQLTVNGQFNLNGQMVLQPSSLPATPTAGQIYFDQARNQLGYYDGKGFVYLQGSPGVTNNYNSTTVNNIGGAVTNITNVSGGGVAAPSGSTGHIAMFTAANTLGDSVITQAGTNLTAGDNTGASSTVLQGGTGGLSLLTGDTSGTSGAVTIQSGASSTTSAGNVSIDTGSNAINGVTEEDFTFENASDVGKVNDFLNGTYTVTQDCTVSHAGSCSLNMTGFGTGGGAQVLTQQYGCPGDCFPVTPGHKYTFSIWVKAATTPNQIYSGVYSWPGCNSPITTDNTSTWTNIVWTCTAPVGLTGSYFIFGFGSFSTVTHYFDDISATDISSSTATAELNLGASNAQAITIGNNNQTGLTAIQGGSGIDINSGFAALSLTGGATSVSANGALTLTAAASSTWSVNSAGNGGNLTIQAGSSSTAANAGNLVLQSGASTGTGSPGSVIVKPGSDSSKAFQVQNAAGNTALALDSGTGVLTVNTASSCSAATYANYANSLSPAAYWKLDDSGATAADSSGNNNTGTLSNVTVNQTPGPLSCDNTHPAMAFNAASPSQITTATSAASPATYSEVVMFKTSSVLGTFIGYSNGGNHDREMGVDNSGKLYSRIYDNGDQIITSSQTVNDGNWHIAATTVSAAGMSLYLDGVLVGFNASYNTPQSYTGSWLIGGGWGVSGAPFNGQLAEVAVYPSALNALQVQTLATYSGFYTATLAAVGIGTTSPAANLDVEGTALFKNGVNSTTAFQIQDASGTNLVTADTADDAVNLGLGGSAALGYAGVGNVTGGGAGINGMTAQKVTTTAAGTIVSMSAYLENPLPVPNNQFQFAIYDDNSGAPGNYVASSSISSITTGGWYTLPISANLAANTTYWLVYWQNSNTGGSQNSFRFIGHNGDLEWYNQVTWQSGPNNGFPAAFPTSGPNATTHPNILASMYATFSASGPAITLSSNGLMTQSGPAVFKDPTDSATAFQIQNSLGDALLTANTADMDITVQAVIITADLTVDGHIITGGSAPGIAAGAAACTTPAVSISGNDTSGTVTVTTGTGCGAGGILAIVTFATAFGAAPHVVLTPVTAAAEGRGYVDAATISSTAFDLDTVSPPADSTTYQWNYLVTQ